MEIHSVLLLLRIPSRVRSHPRENASRDPRERRSRLKRAGSNGTDVRKIKGGDARYGVYRRSSPCPDIVAERPRARRNFPSPSRPARGRHEIGVIATMRIAKFEEGRISHLSRVLKHPFLSSRPKSQRSSPRLGSPPPPVSLRGTRNSIEACCSREN